LAKKRPVRIGISIGIATELRPNELYGKAVADAYELESYIAGYPRAVVSDEVRQYLLKYATEENGKSDLKSHVTGKMAQEVLHLLAPDFDGRLIVNYLGKSFQNLLGPESSNTAFHHAYDFVNDQLKSHQKSQNTKLAFRYSLLHGYFFDHLENIRRG
jgi:hypothetical protein